MPVADIAAVRRRLRHLVESLGYEETRAPLTWDQDTRPIDRVYTLETRETGREEWIGSSLEVRHEVTISLCAAWESTDPHEVVDALHSDAERLANLIGTEPNFDVSFDGEECPDYYSDRSRATSSVRADNAPVAVCQVRLDVAYELDAPAPEFEDGHLVIPSP